MNDKRQLVTSEGYQIQGMNGDITLTDDAVTFNEFGEILAGGNRIDKLKIFNFTNKGDLRKVGSALYDYSEKPEGEQVAFEGKVQTRQRGAVKRRCDYRNDSHDQRADETMKMVRNW